FCFEIIAKDSLLEGAILEIKHVPVKVKCNKCHDVWEVDGAVFSCQSCKDGTVEILSGRELEIVSIELAQ
ncbi:MAG: hydrogenase maturation nickel metallochaperone HypA, partial [Desulfamplus sp.]|nr:hydrogenase maturation nickel metallochaperone HypA [Desulfamplus sp.]